MPKAIIMGRQGVLHTGGTNVHHFRMYPFAREALGLLGNAGYVLGVISNEYAPGRMQNIDMRLIQIQRAIKRNVYFPVHFKYCIDHPRLACECRLPGTGLLEEFMSEFELQPPDITMVAGRENEIVAAQTVGIDDIYAVKTGKKDWKKSQATEVDNIGVVADLLLEKIYAMAG